MHHTLNVLAMSLINSFIYICCGSFHSKMMMKHIGKNQKKIKQKLKKKQQRKEQKGGNHHVVRNNITYNKRSYFYLCKNRQRKKQKKNLAKKMKENENKQGKHAVFMVSQVTHCFNIFTFFQKKQEKKVVKRRRTTRRKKSRILPSNDNK